MVVSVVVLTGMKVQPVEDAIFDTDSAAYVNTAAAEKSFGSDPVVILVKGELQESLKAENLKRLNVLELCVSGGIKRGRGELFKLCDRLSKLDPVQVSTGPATFLTRAVNGITEVYQAQQRRISSLPKGSARAQQAPIGMPLPSALAIVTTSGITP